MPRLTELRDKGVAVKAVQDAAMPGLSSAGVMQLWEANRPHAQGSPGAYEWWRVEAISPEGDGLLLLLFNGMPFHPEYLSRVSRTKRRLKNVVHVPAKVLASSYPAAYMAVYKSHKRIAQSLNMYPPESVESTTEGLEVRIGPNRLTMRADGSIGVEARGYPFTMRGTRAHHVLTQELTATLTLEPTFPGVQAQRRFRPDSDDGAAHQWILAAPHSRARGRVQLIDRQNAEALLDEPLSCHAYHDHMVGQGMLGRDLQKCMWGHAVGDDFAIVWQRTLLGPKRASTTDSLMLFERHRKTVTIESPEIAAEHYRRTSPWLIRYPERILINGSDAHGNPAELVVKHALVDSSPFHWRLRTDATLQIPGRGRYVATGSATAVIMGRLKWPLLSDAVIHAILPVPADDPLWRQ